MTIYINIYSIPVQSQNLYKNIAAVINLITLKFAQAKLGLSSDHYASREEQVPLRTARECGTRMSSLRDNKI